jgi:hypothetical protein
MARHTPTHGPPDFPDEELLPEESVPGGRQLLRMFIPVALAIVVFITVLMLVLKFLVIPAMERGDPNAQARGVATLGALQTQEAVTRTEQALTPQPTPRPASTPQPVATAQPAAQPTPNPAAVAIAPAAAETKTSSVSTTQVVQPTTTAAQPTISNAPATPAAALVATPIQGPIEPRSAPTQPPGVAAPPAVPTVDPVIQAEVLQAYALYWQQRTLAFRDLDPSLLSGVAADPELKGLTGKIQQLRSEGRAIRTHVIHHVVALPTAPGEAVVADEYEDLSTYVDSVTKEPIDPATADPQSGPIVKVREVLQKIDGVWKVTGGEIYE